MNEAVKIAQVNFDYTEKAGVLKDINFSIGDGESVGLVGPNGAGKTTLFHLLCGLMQPESGELFAFGKPVVPNRFNPDIGFIFQNPDDQLFNSSVFDDVAFGPINLGLSKEAVMQEVASALDVTGCEIFRDRPPHHLSGGEKRMVAIATIIAMHPKLVIYDEPTSNLDMRARRLLIRFINGSAGTKIIASHDLEFILEVADRVVVLDEGHIVADGKPKEIMNQASFMEEHGLERPHSLLHLKQDHVHSE